MNRVCYRKLIINLIIVFGLIYFGSGCASLLGEQYYTDPNSLGYKAQVWNGECEKCDKIGRVSTYNLHNDRQLACFYCGHVQDTIAYRERGKFFDQYGVSQKAKVWPMQCEKGNRVFYVSAEEIASSDHVICPYDGHSQDMTQAFNRGQYLQQQELQKQRTAQKQRQAAAIRQFYASQRESRRRSYEKQMDLINSTTQSLLNNSHSTSQQKLFKQTNCSPDYTGGFNCTTY